MTLTLDLASRPGWPPATHAPRKVSRDIWPGHLNLGMTARFWLERHDGFRALGTLTKAADTISARKTSAAGVPKILRAAAAVLPREPRRASSCKRGLQLLPDLPRCGEAAHQASLCWKATALTIHAEILRTVKRQRVNSRAMESDDDARRVASDIYADASERLRQSSLCGISRTRRI